MVKIIEAIGELKAMKPHIESGMSVVGYDAYDMAIRSLELWEIYAEEVEDVYEDEKGEKHLIREWIEDGGEAAETLKPTSETTQNVPYDDLISRKAAIDKFTVASNQDGAYGYLDTKSAVEILNDLPPVQPEQQWTPCSDGMPKKTDYYICTCHDGVCYRTSVLKWSTGWVLTGARSYWKVIAWMPLPAPYRDMANKEAMKE